MRPLPPALEAHFRAPQFAGVLPDGARCGHSENTACGDRLELGIAVDPSGALAVGYRVQGCSALIAVASLVAARLDGQSLDAAQHASIAEWVRDAGGLGPSKQHAITVVERALAGVLAQFARDCHP